MGLGCLWPKIDCIGMMALASHVVTMPGHSGL